MNPYRVVCIWSSRAHLPDKINHVLFQEACKMFLERKKKRSFKKDGCQGTVQTDFAPISLVHINGTAFTADVEHDLGPTRVRFLVRDGSIVELRMTAEASDEQFHEGRLTPEIAELLALYNDASDDFSVN